MNSKIGFIQSEIGLFPDSWEVLPIKDLITEFRGGASLKPSDFTDNGIKVLPKLGVGRGGWLKVNAIDQKYCSPDYAATHHRNEVDETYTIVVLRDLVPSGPAIGLMVQIKNKEVYILAQGVYGFKLKNIIIPEYIVQLSNTNWYRALVNSIMVGSTQVHITNTAFTNILIPLPSVPEQRVIAASLCDMDDYIEAMEKLITKKHQIKQAAMQELLTGKKRLPGFDVKRGFKQTEFGNFPQDWKIKKLGELGECIIGLTYKPSDIASSGLLVLRSSNISDNRLIYDDNVFVKGDVSRRLIVRQGDLLICVRNGSRDLIGKCALIDKNAEGMTFGAFMSVFRSDYSQYIFNQFQSNLIKTQIRENIGATINQITNNNLNSFSIPIPENEEEMWAIVDVLSDMDAEISALEQQRKKIHQLKQGMMQELLTGRVRLV